MRMPIAQHRVIARRDPEGGWVLHIPNVGMVAARSLGVAAKNAMARIAQETGTPEEQVGVVIQPKLDVRLGEVIQRAKAGQAELAKLSASVAAQSRQAAQALRGAGLSNTDIAHLLGVSDQRVSQLFGKTGTKS